VKNYFPLLIVNLKSACISFITINIFDTEMKSLLNPVLCQLDPSIVMRMFVSFWNGCYRVCWFYYRAWFSLIQTFISPNELKCEGKIVFL